MTIAQMLQKNRRTVALMVLAFIVILPLGYYAIRDAFARTAVPFLERPDPKYQNCVRDTQYMRFHHWTLLKEIRTQVVREGKRSSIGLKNCTECHVNRDRFCNRCHDAANVKLDCFGCHNYPDQARQLRASGNPAVR